MSRRNFLKHIEQLGEEELREEIKLLYTKSKEVKHFYALELGEQKDREKIYAKAKKDIASKYATKSRRRPRRPRIQKINTLLSSLHKNAVFPHEMIDIYLFNCECGIEFMRKYYFQSTPLYNGITKSFGKATEIIGLERMQEQHSDRVLKILESVEYFIDLHIEMDKSYYTNFKLES